jgi:hypothetical protein
VYEDWIAFLIPVARCNEAVVFTRVEYYNQDGQVIEEGVTSITAVIDIGSISYIFILFSRFQVATILCYLG